MYFDKYLFWEEKAIPLIYFTWLKACEFSKHLGKVLVIRFATDRPVSLNLVISILYLGLHLQFEAAITLVLSAIGNFVFQISNAILLCVLNRVYQNNVWMFMFLQNRLYPCIVTN